MTDRTASDQERGDKLQCNLKLSPALQLVALTSSVYVCVLFVLFSPFHCDSLSSCQPALLEAHVFVVVVVDDAFCCTTSSEWRRDSGSMT